MNQGFYDELARRLKKADFSPQTVDSEGFMPVEWQGRQLCQVTPSGGVRFQASDMKDTAHEAARDQVYDIAQEVAHIQTLMEKAPTIKAQGLEGDYRALGEFNSIVLAGRQHPYGMEFVTWEWVQNHTSLWQGHYYGDDLAAAQRDFATRSGLVPAERLFSDQQLAIIFDACQTAQVYGSPANPEHEKLLEGVIHQIETALPDVIDLANTLTQEPKPTQSHQPLQSQGIEMGGF